MKASHLKYGLCLGAATAGLALACALAVAAPGEPSTELAHDAGVVSMPPLKNFASIWTESTFRPPDISASTSDTSSRSVGGWSLLALVKIGPEAFAILQKEQSGLRMYVGQKPNANGYSVESTHFDSNPEKEFVTIRHNQQTTDLHYLPPILEQLKKQYEVIEKTGRLPTPSR